MADKKDRPALLIRPVFRVTGREHGFTLIEMLVSISILTVIMAGMFAFLFGASRHWNTSQNQADMTENARLGLNRMTREIKQSSQITTAQINQITFTVNFGTGNETISYGFSAGEGGGPGTVWRDTSVSPGQVTLMENVDSMQFVYYGNDYKCDSNMNGEITYIPELQACSGNPTAYIARVDFILTMRAGNETGQTFVDQAWLRNRVAD
ncbi:MAG: prepilin-type N-terminal cleavage/methylation domain-containing protein [Thermoleophilia bacterium]